MLKKILVALMVVALLLSMTGCGGLERPEIVVSNANEVTHITDAFEGTMTPQEILDELCGIDLTGKNIDYFGMESEKVTDEENSTSITYYSKDGKRVYAVYEGYGEECVDFYTETKSGYKATVKYVYPGTEEAYGDVTFEKDGWTYVATYEDLTQETYYGASIINITILCEDGMYTEYMLFNIAFENNDNSCLLESAKYIDSNGDYRQYINEGYDEILVEKYNDKNELCDVPIEELVDAEILMGPHTVYLGENDEVYIETTLVRIFPEGTGVDKFVKAYNFTKGRDVNDELDIAYNDVVLKFADDCKVDGYESVFGFVMDEYNDYVYRSVSFNEDGEINKVSAGTLSYY